MIKANIHLYSREQYGLRIVDNTPNLNGASEYTVYMKSYKAKCL